MSPRTDDTALDRAGARDRGLRRVRTATGWITVASAAGAAVLAGGYAQAMPGKTASASPVPTHSAATSAHASPSTAEPSAKASAAAPALQPPAQAPTTAPSTAQTQATSGGS